jgi:hypothetical protein
MRGLIKPTILYLGGFMALMIFMFSLMSVLRILLD